MQDLQTTSSGAALQASAFGAFATVAAAEAVQVTEPFPVSSVSPVTPVLGFGFSPRPGDSVGNTSKVRSTL